ncbi:MAG: hypothetical protein IJA22_01285 [Clostridia bacterium]|nr:hypothetical protein [Clostridia bacterium]
MEILPIFAKIDSKTPNICPFFAISPKNLCSLHKVFRLWRETVFFLQKICASALHFLRKYFAPLGRQRPAVASLVAMATPIKRAFSPRGVVPRISALNNARRVTRPRHA